MTISFETLKSKMLKNPKVRAAYEARAAEFELANELIAARARAGLSQAQLARRMKTTQSAIARIESGKHWPSRRTLERYAKATRTRPVIRLVAAE
jgi:ribosome-binding protein aMBF1 (putative translation factor)